jgi:hypothetical protein
MIASRASKTIYTIIEAQSSHFATFLFHFSFFNKTISEEIVSKRKNVLCKVFCCICFITVDERLRISKGKLGANFVIFTFEEYREKTPKYGHALL